MDVCLGGGAPSPAFDRVPSGPHSQQLGVLWLLSHKVDQMVGRRWGMKGEKKVIWELDVGFFVCFLF